MHNKLFLALLVFLSACSSDIQPERINLDYSSLGKLYINTADLRIINRANAPQYAPYVGHTFTPRLIDAVNRLAGDRLQAAGQLGHATLIVKDANVTEQSLSMSSDFESLFTRQQGSKLVGRVEVSLEAQSPKDGSVAMANAHAVYSATLPEDPTEAERYDAYGRLVNALMSDLNKELERGIRKHMSAFLLTGPAADQSPTPTKDSAMPATIKVQ